MRRVAVLGFPVGHSRSPAMQNAALEALGLAPEWQYGSIEVAPDQFEERVREIAAAGYVGANVTVPHKSSALALADDVSETAREIGAANTLSFADGEIRADNTDAPGLLDTLPESPAGKRALVLGAGGAGRAVVWALVREGAKVEIWNRTRRRSDNLAAELGGIAVDDPDGAEYGLVVNTTAVGLGGEDPFAELPLRPDSFRPGQTVVEMVYGAEPTRLQAAATAAGATVVDGLEVLVRQGGRSLEIWTGRDAPLAEMRAAARGRARR